MEEFEVPWNIVLDEVIEWKHTCQDGDEECAVCAMKECPFNDPHHLHHDGCPSCWVEENRLAHQIADKVVEQVKRGEPEWLKR